MEEKLYEFYILKNKYKVIDEHGFKEWKIEEEKILVREETANLFNEIINKGCTTLRRPNENYGERDLYMF